MRPMIRSILKKLGTATVAAAAVATLACHDLPSPVMPAPVEVNEVVQLHNSNWKPDERQWYYHSSQGSRLMPYTWFISLEQLEHEKPFLADDHITRFRVIPDTNRENNPDRLPLGFAKDCLDPIDPAGLPVEYVGISCAACHTGQITYKGKGLLIDGAPGQLDVFAFLGSLGLAVKATEADPAKLDRFARKVLGKDYDSANKDKLRKDIQKYIREQLASIHPFAFSEKVIKSGLKLTDPGFGRIDALGQGGNTLFGLLSAKNVRTLDAPVDILPLWYASSYGWVQTNSAIRQPMARNIIEALAVNMYLELPKAPGDTQEGYRSSARLENSWMLESMGAQLWAPEWPAELGAPDLEKAKRGEALYQQHCAKCHEPRLETPSADDNVPPALRGVIVDQDSLPVLGGPPNPPEPFLFDPVSAEEHKRFYHLLLFDIGTDPGDATNFAKRHADATAMGPGFTANMWGPKIIFPVIAGIMERYYTDQNILPGAQMLWNGYRGNYWRAPEAYPARPLAGIWATAPFLHNGSVPNLYELLSPVAERSKVFYRGNLEYDPVNVGFETRKFKGAFKFDTSVTGNSNSGHEFGGTGKGVIGPELTVDERWQIIEYLKVLRFEPEVKREWKRPTGWPKNLECPR